ncbi:MAG: transposase [bacterium]
MNRLYFQQSLLELVTPYQQSKIKEQANLANVMASQINEMFVFIELPYVIPENNLAERSVRPDVIARKISGGTRTEQGSKTRMILPSIIRTCHLRNLDPIASIQNMLLRHPIFDNPAV